MPSTSNSGGSTTGSGVTSAASSSPACSACKYQRKKCSKNCLLAPYFPHDQHAQFINVHKLFGVSNITKTIKNLDEHQRSLAIRNMILEADMRARDPVGGIYKVALQLHQQIQSATAELNAVLQQLALVCSIPQETPEVFQGNGNLPEQQPCVMNNQNLQDQYMQQSFATECTYDNYDENGNKMPEIKVSSDETQDVKHEQEGVAGRKSNMAWSRLLTSSYVTDM